MTRIEKKFNELKKGKKKAFIAYITAGDPSWGKTVQIIHALERAGVDILELGIPFSDPMADGPVIQRASERAIKSGMTLEQALIGLKEIRKKSEIPVLLFTYYNPIHKMGLQKFASMARKAGADGVLVTDLTPESASEYKQVMKREKLNTVFLAAPTTPRGRLKKIAQVSSGFIYYISRTGVTGVSKKLDPSIAGHVKSIKKLTELPVGVGFGVSTPDQVRQVSHLADGVVVGSAIVKKIEETKGNAAAVYKFVRNLCRPLR